jgi:5-methylcytosine-specific restriction endonuclease McrA
VPIIRGGRNSPDNLVIACQVCNNRKYNKLPHEWIEGGRLL